jgi:protein O-GlcNAc transferase
VSALTPSAILEGAIAAFGSGRFAEACRASRMVLAAAPDHPTALLVLAAALAADRRDLALIHVARAAQIAPTAPEVHNTAGNLLAEAGETNAAALRYRRALALAPALAEGVYNLGTTLRSSEAKARHWLQRATALTPARADAWANLAVSGGPPADSHRAAKTALVLAPSHPVGWVAHGLAALGLLDAEEAVRANRRALAADDRRREPWINLLTAIHYDPSTSSAEIFATIRRWARLMTEDGRHQPPPREQTPPRLRIGYLSADLRRHVVAGNLIGLVAHHDPARFETFFYAAVRRPDEVSHALMRHGTWRSIADLEDRDAAALIREDRIDILVCLAGHTSGNRPAIPALRPAPVQLSLFDLSTTGLGSMDGWITDAVLHPTDTRERFTERLLRLPRCLYLEQPPEFSPPPGPPPSAGGAPITWGCFANPAKLTEVALATMARILAATPGSRLLLAYTDRYAQPMLVDRVAAALARWGVGRDRLIVSTEALARDAHLARIGRADIALDSFPFNGSTTTFETLWMGVPVITLAGERFLGRVGASLLTAIGETSLIAASLDDYVAKAVALAGDGERLQRLRAELRPRLLASPLCDASAYARAVEALYLDAWARR